MLLRRAQALRVRGKVVREWIGLGIHIVIKRGEELKERSDF